MASPNFAPPTTNQGGAMPVSATTYPISVGGGGAEAVSQSHRTPAPTVDGSRGNTSSFNSVSATGGGGGAGWDSPSGGRTGTWAPGGSGGGGTGNEGSDSPGGAATNYPGTTQQGFPGGIGTPSSTGPRRGGGGGGGAGAAGGPGAPTTIGAGGDGLQIAIAVYWPAFLLAADIPPPKRVYGHGWILSGEEKMSKSKGNILDPIEIIDQYGLDPLRYYLIKEVSFGNDGNSSQEKLESCINSDLANNYGNLCQRVFSFIKKNCSNKIPKLKIIS